MLKMMHLAICCNSYLERTTKNCRKCKGLTILIINFGEKVSIDLYSELDIYGFSFNG
jgi:hypothetical protein